MIVVSRLELGFISQQREFITRDDNLLYHLKSPCSRFILGLI